MRIYSRLSRLVMRICIHTHPCRTWHIHTHPCRHTNLCSKKGRVSVKAHAWPPKNGELPVSYEQANPGVKAERTLAHTHTHTTHPHTQASDNHRHTKAPIHPTPPYVHWPFSTPSQPPTKYHNMCHLLEKQAYLLQKFCSGPGDPGLLIFALASTVPACKRVHKAPLLGLRSCRPQLFQPMVLWYPWETQEKGDFQPEDTKGMLQKAG